MKKKTTNIKISLLFALIFVTIPCLVIPANADFGDNIEKIRFDPAFTSDPDIKLIILYSEGDTQSDDRFSFIEFNDVATKTITNKQVTVDEHELEDIDYIFILNSDTEEDGNADDWTFVGVEFYNSGGLIGNKWIFDQEYGEENTDDLIIGAYEVKPNSCTFDSTFSNELIDTTGFEEFYDGGVKDEEKLKATISMKIHMRPRLTIIGSHDKGYYDTILWKVDPQYYVEFDIKIWIWDYSVRYSSEVEIERYYVFSTPTEAVIQENGPGSHWGEHVYQASCVYRITARIYRITTFRGSSSKTLIESETQFVIVI